MVLSAPASRLLLTLVVNSNTPLKREYLLSTVWEDYGFTASGSNLNNYISELRKSLAYLVPEFSGIVTIPKIGFQFTANIETSLPKNSQQEKSSSLLEAPSLITHQKDLLNNEDKTRNNKFEIKRIKTYQIIFIITLPIIILLTYYISIPNYAPKIESSKFIYTQDNCDIYTLDEFNSMSNNEIVQVIKKRLATHNISCNTNNQYDIFYSSLPAPNPALLITNFIGICIKDEQKDKQHMYKNCHSFVSEV
ncbi:winged helix-turn-helix domain-containing protein [Providencia burhodogranariea]|uniref:winged helix-turn-helix domain-containing protein n=1 Tax=Providencia burhodogranariea TaxID=516074 RepID=UPI00130E181B|nr:helix-turn-helix domain-containing protein [Providencia burhodogranariea]